MDVEPVIDLLLTIGYVDGLLHEDEKKFIEEYLERVILHVAPSDDERSRLRTRVEAAYVRLDKEIGALAAEVVAAGDKTFMRNRLKVRAVARFRGFAPADQKVALDLFEHVMRTDGSVSEEERELHEELRAYFHATPSLPDAVPPEPPPDMLVFEPVGELPLTTKGHPLLDPIEQPYAADAAAFEAQVASDYHLIFQAITVWERQRSRGNGRLAGVTDVTQFPQGVRFLDGHVHVLRPNGPTELFVLGDVHGCYSCLKAAVLQSGFIDKAHAYQRDPSLPYPLLVLLGDYLDRGRFSFEGVLRAALHLLVSLPDHVILLRGNHEFFVRHGDSIVSAVMPAEALPELAARAPIDVLEAYRHLFDHMPTSFLFERTMFVHGGIPRDDTLADRYRDLSSLDDSVLRFEMMWADPVETDHVPVTLQRESPRFTFGHDQFRSFMTRVGLDTLIRGHEQVDGGFATTYDLGRHRLHTLFSAGGRENSDLPEHSRYRDVTPMALTIRWDNGLATAKPWPIAYQSFCNAQNNGLYRT